MSKLFPRKKRRPSKGADSQPLNDRDASEAGARLRESLARDSSGTDDAVGAHEDGTFEAGGGSRQGPAVDASSHPASGRRIGGYGDYADEPPSAERRSPLQQSQDFTGGRGVRRTELLPNALIVVVLLSMVYIVAGTFVVGGDSSGQDSAAGSGGLSPAERAASSVAQSFATSYLALEFGDTSDIIGSRIAPFLAEDIDETLITPNVEGTASRRVLSANTADVRPMSENKYEVRIQTSVATATEASLADSGVSVEDLGPESVSTSSSGGSEGGGSSGPVSPAIPAEAETVKRMDMLVEIGVGEDGSASVVAPPTLTEPRSQFSGETGAISGPNAQSLDDGPILELVEGYLASAYGSQESRGSLENYLAAGGRMPPTPDTDLDFLGLDAGTGYIYPVDLDGAGSQLDGFSRVFDVEAYAEVEDPETGVSYYQSQLLRVGESGGEWKIIGPVPDERASGS